MFGISKNIQKLLKKNMEKRKTVLMVHGEEIEEVNIKRGIFQGDFLSPLLFDISLIPMSIILYKTGFGYHISQQAGKINHLFYMDDLKLYAKSSMEIELLLNTVQNFSEDIQMKFGIDKCAALSIHCGKIQKLDRIEF